MKIEEWITALIDRFREEFTQLSKEEREAASRTLSDLSYPCQVLVIWAKEPEFQIIIFSHIRELEDKMVKIYGPIDNDKLVDEIEKRVLSDPLVKSIGRERVEKCIIRGLLSIQGFFNPLRSPPKMSRIIVQSRIGNEPFAFSWLIVGNIAKMNLNDVVNRCIENIKSVTKPSVSVKLPEEKEKVLLKGFGTYIYPPVWIGEIPKPTFRERLSGSLLWKYSDERVLTTTYKGVPLIVMRDGYIAIGVENKLKALSLLNEIMATLLITRGIPVFIAREWDLGEVEIKEHGISKSWNPFSVRAKLYSERFGKSFDPKMLELERRLIREEDMMKVIRWSELITADERLRTLLLLSLEAYTHMVNGEYKQALVMGWVILEDFYIESLWSQHVLGRVEGARKRKLKRWTTEAKLEALDIANILPHEEYAILQEIKRERNSVVHEGKEPPKEVVDQCLKLIFKVVRNYLGNYLATHMHKL